MTSDGPVPLLVKLDLMVMVFWVCECISENCTKIDSMYEIGTCS